MLRILALVAALAAAPAFAQWPSYFGGSSGGCTAGQACTGTTITATTAFVVGSSTDVYLTRYAAKQLMISGDGTGATTNSGLILGYGGSTGAGAIYRSTDTPSLQNNSIIWSNASADYVGSAAYNLRLTGFSVAVAPSGTDKMTFANTAGAGPSITAGTAATDVNGLSLTQTLNGAVAFNTILSNVTVTSQTAGSLHLNLQRAGTLQYGITNGATSTGTQIRTAQQTAPTCSSNCGTSPSVTGSDSAMTVTMGASGVPASGWVVTFNGTWASAPACSVTPAVNTMAVGKMPIAVVTTTTTATVTTNGTAPSTSDKYHVKCTGIS